MLLLEVFGRCPESVGRKGAVTRVNDPHNSSTDIHRSGVVDAPNAPPITVLHFQHCANLQPATALLWSVIDHRFVPKMCLKSKKKMVKYDWRRKYFLYGTKRCDAPLNHLTHPSLDIACNILGMRSVNGHYMYDPASPCLAR